MLKTNIIYQWNSGSTAKVLNTKKNKRAELSHNGLVYFIQVVSAKPLDILSEKQKIK